MEKDTLRVIVSTNLSDGSVEAQMLELDIAVRARSEEGLLSELRHAIVMEYRIANQYGRTPFLHLIDKTPEKFKNEWNEWEDQSDQVESLGSLDLPIEISAALGAALHRERSSFTIAERKKAA